MQGFKQILSGIHSIAWIKEIPGNFVTCNEKIPAIKIWNVSNKSPLKTIKIGKPINLIFISVYW